VSKLIQHAIVLVVLAAIPLLAEEPRVNKEAGRWVEVTTGTINPAKVVKINTDAGSVSVTGGDSQNITWVVTKRSYSREEAEARRQFATFSMRPVVRPDYLVLDGNYVGGRERGLDIQISVTLPRNTSMLKIETRGGHVNVNNVAGKVDTATLGGNIHLSGVGGPTLARTSGGGIDVGEAGGELRLETAGGNISVGSATGKVLARTAGGTVKVGSAPTAVLETAGGNILVDKCSGELKASTAGGNLNIGQVEGPATLETSGGSIRLGSAKGVVKATTSGGEIHLNHLAYGAIARTAAGPITTEFVAQKGNFTDSVLETSGGDVVVYLPADLAVTIKATIENASGHTIRSDFSEIKINREGGDYGPGEVFGQGAINGGGPLLKISTTAGNIELHRGTH
jgi:DUF4097 and DUF4098 domain-containing protein YvlB